MCTTWDLKLPRIELIPADKNEGLFPCMLSFVADLFAIPSVIGWHDQGSIVQTVGYRCLSTDESHPADKYWGNQLSYPMDSVIHFLNNWSIGGITEKHKTMPSVFIS